MLMVKKMHNCVSFFLFLIMEEHYFTCPYCWEQISMLMDDSVTNQEYIEDCEVCCNPIQIKVRFQNSEIIEFQALNIEQ